MKQMLIELFSEKGNISMMRLLSFVCVLTASGIAVHAVILNKDLNAASILCATFLSAGIGGKLAQKMTEVKDGD